MITPTFHLEQDDLFVTIVIYTPHIRAQEVDMFISGDEFKLYVKPYFLRLHLPGNLVEDERASATYDVTEGKITAKIPKETPGEHFPDLEILPKLLARRGEDTANSSLKSAPLIEVLSEDDEATDTAALQVQAIEEAKAFDWQLPQEIAQTTIVLSSFYGFNQQYQGYFTYWTETGNDVNEIDLPEQSTIESRRTERIKKENNKFDDDYYISDFMQKEWQKEEGEEDEGEIARLIKYRTIWWDELRQRQKAVKQQSNDHDSSMEQLSLDNKQANMIKTINLNSTTLLVPELEFTPDEEKMLQELPNKQYLISDEKSIYLGLVDIIFAYSYDHRISEGELTVESAWTLCKTSATLSSLESFTTLDEVMIAGYRRALAYPLYRHWELTEKVWTDVYVLFKLGKRALLKALLAVKQMLDQHDIYHIYSQLYVTDYCIWLQQARDTTLRSLARELHQTKIEKDAIGWHLEALERLTLESENEEEEESEEEESEEEESEDEDDSDESSEEEEEEEEGEENITFY
ncbi:SHQ1 protein-domain-containing protein [Syncephalis fuscata]|nr:SHQ1 protein-domain-containing protein [Syncephalis fuscata]